MNSRDRRHNVRAEDGLTAIQYSVMVALMIAVVVAGMSVADQKILELFNGI